MSNEFNKLTTEELKELIENPPEEWSATKLLRAYRECEKRKFDESL